MYAMNNFNNIHEYPSIDETIFYNSKNINKMDKFSDLSVGSMNSCFSLRY